MPSAGVKEGIPIYVYVPSNVTKDPAIFVYCHGGGNVVGCRENVDTVCKIIAKCVFLLVREFRDRV